MRCHPRDQTEKSEVLVYPSGMARNKDTFAYQCKLWLIVYWLPSEAVAVAFPVILGAYNIVLSVLRNLAANESQDELNNPQTLFEQPGFEEQFYNYTEPENYTAIEPFGDNYTVTVSNAVLWVCRKGSPDGHFYRTLYGMAIGFLIAFHLLTGFYRFFTVRFWYAYDTSESGDKTTIERYPKDCGIAFITIVGAFLLNSSFLLLLLSFDISPWSCLSKPSEVCFEYTPFSNRVDIQIQHSPGAITFQKAASVLSLVLAFSWVVVRIVFFGRDVANENVEHRQDKFRDAPDTGPADQDHELLEVNIEETTEQDS